MISVWWQSSTSGSMNSSQTVHHFISLYNCIHAVIQLIVHPGRIQFVSLAGFSHNQLSFPHGIFHGKFHCGFYTKMYETSARLYIILSIYAITHMEWYISLLQFVSLLSFSHNQLASPQGIFHGKFHGKFDNRMACQLETKAINRQITNSHGKLGHSGREMKHLTSVKERKPQVVLLVALNFLK